MFVVLVMMMLMPLQLQKQEDPYPQALEKIAAQVTNPLNRHRHRRLFSPSAASVLCCTQLTLVAVR